MGTPELAASILEHIIDVGADTVIGAVTQPDKPRGRGYELSKSAVKKLSEEKNIPVYQPVTLRDNAFSDDLEELSPDVIVVAAYGKILPDYVLDFPKHGCINVHGSLLPKYRGAAPIQRALIDGERETGITIMKMDAGLDTGDMMLKRSIVIDEADNFETLHDKMVECGKSAIIEALDLIRDGRDEYTKQDGTLATYAEKIEKSDCVIDFDDAESVHNRIRGLSPIPLAFSKLDSKMIKFTSSIIIDRERVHTSEDVGKILYADEDKSVIAVACKKGVIGITGVLPEGKKRMSSSDFIRGKKSLVGERFVLDEQMKNVTK